MNINIIDSIILNIITLMIIIRLANCSTSCSIFPSLNCSCFQSDSDLILSLPIKTYSHLHCHGSSFNKKTFQPPYGFDFQIQNRFRTVSIEFSPKKQVEIPTNQFNPLSMLFTETDDNAQIEISIRFNGFSQIKFNKQSFTSNMFHRKHQNKHLWLRLIPTISNYNQIESSENDPTNLEEQFKFSDNSFAGLSVSQLNIYIHTKRDRFPSSFPFEHIFNNTNIGELHFHGAIIPPGSISLRRTFKGLVRSLTLHRRVDTVDSNTFPYYFPVYSYNIHSIEAHSIDLDSFIPLYNNLRGLELIKPRFQVSIDKFIPTLDSLTLDIEDLNEQTLLSAGHIYNLKLGSRLRRINPQVLYSLANRLKNLDLSDIDLSEMTSDSRCYLIDFISKAYQRHLNINLPRIDHLTGCDCARIILTEIESIKNSKENINNDFICSKQCRFSECSAISEYFREKYPLFTNDNQVMNTINEPHDNLPSIDFFADPVDVQVMTFLINETNNQQMDLNRRRTTIIAARTPATTIASRVITRISATTVLPILEDSSYDISFSTPKFFSSINNNKNQLSIFKKEENFSWIPFLIGGIIVLLLIVVIISSILLIARHRKKKHFVRVPVYV